MKKREIQQLKTQRNQNQDEIVLQEKKIQTIRGELDDLSQDITLFKNCDLEEGRSVAGSIELDLARIEEILQQRKEISAAFEKVKLKDNTIKKLEIEAQWQYFTPELNKLNDQVSQKQKSINQFLVLCQRAKCKPDAMTDVLREQYIKKYTETTIQPCLDKQGELQICVETLQKQELEIAQKLQTELQALSKQYRKAAYLMVGLAVVGMGVASVVAALISAWALYILVLSAVTAGMAAWRGQYFFQEYKKYDLLSSYLNNMLSSSHA